MQLSYQTSIWAAQFGWTALADSLAVIDLSGTRWLLLSAMDGTAMASIALGAAPGIDPPRCGIDFAWQIGSGVPWLYNLAGYNAPLTARQVGANLGPAQIVQSDGGPLTNARAMQVLEYSSGDLAVIAQRGTPGLGLFHLTDQGGLVARVQMQDGAKTYLDGVTDTAVLQRGSDRLLLTISPLENGVTSHRISADGAAEWIDSLGAREGLAVNGLSMIQTATLGGTDFAIVAASVSSSLTVLRVNPLGVFFETDTVIDDRSTRFAHVVAFDTFAAQGRLFVVASGTDAGITLFELLPAGTLSTVASFSLEGAQGPQAVTAISAELRGNAVDIRLIDASATRIFHYGLSLDDLGARVDAVAGQAVGDGLDNRLIGSALADRLFGGGGADFLHDGGGSDVLTGGAGADVFVLCRDGAVDRVTDFTPGQDRLDLSDWGRIYTMQGLTITPSATGAEVDFGAEHLIVASANGTSLMLTEADFLF